MRRDRSNLLTVEHLKSILSYDRESGIFTWKFRDGGSNKFNTRFSGKVAGRSNPDTYGYNTITIYLNEKAEYFPAHRLAWFYTYGVFPPKGYEIDHINYDPWDNRISNLRLATRSQNNLNSDKSAKNTSGHKGVIWDKTRTLWRAEIQKDGKRYYLGRYADYQTACAVWREKAKELFGEFARMPGDK